MKTCCMIVEKDFHILSKESLGSGSERGEIRRIGRGMGVLDVLARWRFCGSQRVRSRFNENSLSPIVHHAVSSW